MQDVAHDRLVRHLGVVGMRVVDRVALAFGHVGGERFAVIAVGRVIGQAQSAPRRAALFLPLRHDLRQEGVGAGGVVGRVGKR